MTPYNLVTVVVVSAQVFGIDVQVVVGVQLPKLAVDDVEVFIGEVVGDLVDVFLLLQQRQSLKEVAAAQLHHGDAAGPRAVDHVVDPLDHLVNTAARSCYHLKHKVTARGPHPALQVILRY